MPANAQMQLICDPRLFVCGDVVCRQHGADFKPRPVVLCLRLRLQLQLLCSDEERKGCLLALKS